MLILCIRSNKVGKRKPGLLSCDSDQTPVYAFGGTASLAHARTGKGSARFQGCKEQVPRGVLSPFAGPSHHRGDRRCPSSGHSFTGSFSTNPKFRGRRWSESEFHPGPASTGQEGPTPTPNWCCRAESEPGGGGGGGTRTDQAQTPKLGGGSQQQKCPCLSCNGTRPGTTVTPFSPSLKPPPTPHPRSRHPYMHTSLEPAHPPISSFSS